MRITTLLTEWQNVIFTVSFVIGLVYALIYAFVGIEKEFHADVEQLGTVLAHLLSFLGIGRCPLSIILIVLTISWGFIGLTSNALLIQFKFLPGTLYFWPSLAIATFLGLFVTRFISASVARIIPSTETDAVDVISLVGRTGEARTLIDKNGGNARVRDRFGTIHNVYCKTAETDEGGTIHPDEAIILLQYLEERCIFIVAKKPELPVD